MRTVQGFVTAERCEKHRAKMARWREAKRLKRESSNEPVREEWRGKFALTITVHNRIDGTMHALDFYISQRRINSYRVTVDSRPWKSQISMSAALAGLRKTMPHFATP